MSGSSAKINHFSMNAAENYDNDVRLSDAFRWLFRELGHIRRLHFTLTLLSMATITFTALAKGEPKGIYRDLEKFQSYFSGGDLDRVFRQVFSNELDAYAPHGLPDNPTWFRNRITEALVRPHLDFKAATESMKLSEVRNRWETTGVRVTLISRIDLPNDSLANYYKWQREAIGKNYQPGDHTATVIWPTGSEPGRIEYVAEAGIQFQSPSAEPMLRDRIPGLPQWPQGPVWVRSKFSTTATFTTRSEVWKLPSGWFERTFPFVASDWKVYSELPPRDAVERAKDRLAGEFVTITLPLGVMIPKAASLIILPIVLILLLLFLFFEVRYVSSFAVFCETRWSHRNPCFLSPWVGGRDWWLRGPLMFLSYLLVVTAVVWLFYSFPILGTRMSYTIVLILFVVISCLMYGITKAGQRVGSLSFPPDRAKLSKNFPEPPPQSSAAEQL